MTEEYLKEIETIVKCHEEVNTDEVIEEKEVIVSDADKDVGMLYRSDKKCLVTMQALYMMIIIMY